MPFHLLTSTLDNEPWSRRVIGQSYVEGRCCPTEHLRSIFIPWVKILRSSSTYASYMSHYGKPEPNTWRRLEEPSSAPREAKPERWRCRRSPVCCITADLRQYLGSVGRTNRLKWAPGPQKLLSHRDVYKDGTKPPRLHASPACRISDILSPPLLILTGSTVRLLSHSGYSMN
jgi:hypothetical protein